MPLRKVWRGLSSRRRALDLFGTFRVWDTEDNNGVLLYVNLADRMVEIVADRASARVVGDERWHQICGALRKAFWQGDYERGTLEAIDEIHAELTRHFAIEHVHHAVPADAPTML